MEVTATSSRRFPPCAPATYALSHLRTAAVITRTPRPAEHVDGPANDSRLACTPDVIMNNATIVALFSSAPLGTYNFLDKAPSPNPTASVPTGSRDTADWVSSHVAIPMLFAS
jgi:hypothetical protein